ncbi:unnamed protein product [Rotaria sp. Silwood2]|nr:unnamed protein product [Rotaria sp. Silwood2]CAF2650052.1 unnamed protein product [Rotaria sp. Silwood2]CAF2903491.1 unnamed protein product [Rotaria sp. Silwood2]CAF3057329.1 unnamed protein product [Rotaria sp. Silwood2]CAF3889483.1 unnamed protein product [Rotaria sp. Silwood2]
MHYNFSSIQPNVNDDNWNNDDNEGEGSIVLNIFRPTTPISKRSSVKNKHLQCHQTNDTIQARQHRTPLQQLQAIFRPTREIHNTMITNKQLHEHEHIPMVNKKINN